MSQNSATVAALDVIVALLIAAKRYSDPHYQSEALRLAEVVRSSSLDATGLLEPGDAWRGPKNPSYASLVAFELLRRLDSTHAADWQRVLECHLVWLGVATSPAGLAPNWCDASGAPVDPANGVTDWERFGFDAMRVP